MICTNCGHDNPEPEIVIPTWYEILTEIAEINLTNGTVPKIKRTLMSYDHMEAKRLAMGLSETQVEHMAWTLKAYKADNLKKVVDVTASYWQFVGNDIAWNGNGEKKKAARYY